MALAPKPAIVSSGVAESGQSAISWAAIIGGAVVASALALILLALGTGVGLSSVSPYANSGASPAPVTVAPASIRAISSRRASRARETTRVATRPPFTGSLAMR